MSTIALPPGFCPNAFSLMLNTVQRASSSPFGGSEQVVDLLNDRWAVSMSAPARRSGDAAMVEAFIASLRGMTNTVNLYHFARPVPRGTMRGTPTCYAMLQGADAISIGGAAVGSTLLAGDMIGVGGMLLQLAAGGVANGGGEFGLLPLVNRVRKFVPDNAAVTWDRPTAPFRLASSAAVQYVPGYSPEVSFEFLEAIS